MLINQLDRMLQSLPHCGYVTLFSQEKRGGKGSRGGEEDREERRRNEVETAREDRGCEGGTWNSNEGPERRRRVSGLILGSVG